MAIVAALVIEVGFCSVVSDRYEFAGLALLRATSLTGGAYFNERLQVSSFTIDQILTLISKIKYEAFVAIILIAVFSFTAE